MANAMKIEVGTEIHYSGDQANNAANGKVVQIIPENKYCGEIAVIEWDNENRKSNVPVYMFNSDRTGTRFETKEAFMSRRKNLLEKLYGMN